MNILFIEREFYPTLGGVERVTYTLGEALRAKGHSVFYAFYGRDDALCASQYKLRFALKSSDDDLQNLFESFIKNKRIDLLICQNVHIPRFQRIYQHLKEKTGIRIITCLHGSPDMWVNKNKWGCTFSRIYFKELIRSVSFRLRGNPYKTNQSGMYELSDEYVLLSDAFKPVFCKLNNVDGRKLHAISDPCAFSGNIDSEIKKENVILVVSRMAEQQKRISNVLRIWKHLFAKYPDWRLEMVGDGPDLKKYIKMSENLKLQRIEFVGSSSTPELYYKKAKIFFMTSIWEGFGMTLIESMHYGCVPVAFDSYAALHDIIAPNINGEIIPLHDFDTYLESVEVLITDTEKLEKMSANARKQSSSFDLSVIVEKWENLLKRK